ncbi:uncharacterized protein LOC100907407 [Galendromus occidentalis]|uniref:Uncharacterized protein LOC100907407 n=1 Tax=Galendromus occidentalis TaxID=34638 RepID=A0AAJ6QNV0_9ACAR|nr:uncharacterized protein LOC100907407 [Galendromus occidentalis]
MLRYALIALLPLVICQPVRQHSEENYGPPQPYEFSYTSQDLEGSHGHSQQADASGRVQGHYSIQLADGRTRTVHYTADENGYRAEIQTNEIGTESKSPANRIYVFAVLIGVALAGHHFRAQQSYGVPMPYQFSYNSQDREGSHGHSQTSDGKRVQGHYYIQLADGRQRRVEYHADETGFHAKIVTNEQGTESKDSADAMYQSTAIGGDHASQQYASGYKSHRATRNYQKWQ